MSAFNQLGFRFFFCQWFYAFNIVPMTDAPMSVLLAEPPNTTDFPFMTIVDPTIAGGIKRPLDDGNAAFFWGEEGRDPKRQGNVEDAISLKQLFDRKMY